ncbi:MAG: hypothetical protein V3V74_07765 [Nitrosomonadaceae bacterium]
MTRDEIRIQVDKAFLKKIDKQLGGSSKADIGRSALTLLNWALDEATKGRKILSVSGEGTDMRELVMPELQRAASLDEN